MRISLKWALFSGVIGLLVISVSIILASSYLTSQKVLLGHARDIMENIATFTVKESQHYLSPAQDAAQLTQKLAYSDVVSNRRIDKLERYFYEQLRLHSNFAGIYIGFVNGEFVYINRMDDKVPQGFRTKVISITNGERRTKLIWWDSDLHAIDEAWDDEDTYDPRQRPWYIDSVRSGQTVWTDPYVFYTSQKPGLTAASPVYNQSGQLTGVVGVDIEIDEISRFLSQLKVGKRGKAFILSHNGDLVAFPDLAKIRWPTGEKGDPFRLAKITEIDDILALNAYQSIEKKFKHLTDGQHVFGSFTHDNQIYHTMFAPFTNQHWPWLIGLYLPEDDYIGSLKANRTFNIYIMLVIAMVGSFIGYLIVRGIVRSMSALQKEAQAVMAYDLETTYEKRSPIKEIQAAVDSFTQMKVGLADYQRQNLELAEGLKAHTRELQTKELQLRSTLTTLVNFADALIVLDQARCIRFLNPRAEHLLQVNLASVLGRPFMFPVSPDQNTEIDIPVAGGAACIAKMQVTNTEWEGEEAFLVALRDITERKQMEKDQKRLLIQAEGLYRRAEDDARTKSVLLKEINHRVKNNLAAIIGLLYAERRHSKAREQADFQKALNGVIHQIQGLATVHDLLSASGWQPLPLSDLVDKVIQGALQVLPSDKILCVDIAPVAIRVAPAVATSLAMIVNECATNSIKYALQDRDRGRIDVLFTSDDAGRQIHFTYRDNGPGYPVDVLRFERHNTGLYLLKNIVERELNGDLTLINDNGAVTRITFHLTSDQIASRLESRVTKSRDSVDVTN